MHKGNVKTKTKLPSLVCLKFKEMLFNSHAQMQVSFFKVLQAVIRILGTFHHMFFGVNVPVCGSLGLMDF